MAKIEVGTRVALQGDGYITVENCLVGRKGQTGMVVPGDAAFILVKMDEPISELEDWGNVVWLNDEEDFLSRFDTV